MSESTVEQLTVTRGTRTNGKLRFECPHCYNALPFNELTKCTDCGAHLELIVRTQVPPTYTNETADDEGDE